MAARGGFDRKILKSNVFGPIAGRLADPCFGRRAWAQKRNVPAGELLRGVAMAGRAGAVHHGGRDSKWNTKNY